MKFFFSQNLLFKIKRVKVKFEYFREDMFSERLKEKNFLDESAVFAFMDCSISGHCFIGIGQYSVNYSYCFAGGACYTNAFNIGDRYQVNCFTDAVFVYSDAVVGYRQNQYITWSSLAVNLCGLSFHDSDSLNRDK